MRGPRLLLVLLLLTAFTLTALDARSGEGAPFEAAAPRRRHRPRTGAARARRRRLAVAGALDGESEADERAARGERPAAGRAAPHRRPAPARRASSTRCCGSSDAGSYPVVPARVTASGSAFGFESTVTLDAGSTDGIEPGQTVVDGDGLLGRTVRVGPFTSTVLLLTDPGFTVGARLDRAGHRRARHRHRRRARSSRSSRAAGCRRATRCSPPAPTPSCRACRSGRVTVRRRPAGW